MIGTSALLLAQGAIRITFEWGRIQSNADWILPVAATLAILLLVRMLYLRDAEELPAATGWLLTALRSVVFLGLLVFYLEPQWRTEREVIRNSRVLLAVDTSSSMGITDAGTPAAQGSSRVQQVARALAKGDFLQTLRKTHDVVVFRFDEDIERIVTLGKGDRGQGTADKGRRAGESKSFPGRPSPSRIDWDKALSPTGKETRLGQALCQLLSEERSAPVSGVVLFTDGGQNAGVSPETAIALAQEARIPMFTVGVGSEQQPTNVRVYRLEALPRAYPGDPFSVSGLIQAQDPSGKLAGKSVAVELLQRDAEPPGRPGTGTLVETQQVILGADGESVPVRFEITPTQTGRRVFVLRVVPPAGDRNPLDDSRESEVEVVARKDRVLLLAGGPTREYGFLRPLLFRDKSIILDVLLQTAQPGISQEANKILDSFPSTREEMYAYDCVVGFDPNWKALNAEQIGLLESWVAEQAGGLIVIAGPVYLGESVNGWVSDPAMSKIRALYPVEFHRRVGVGDTLMTASKEPWPLEFTREGLEAQYLWLADSQTDSQQAWAGFSGVYGYYPVRGPKPAATVLARCSDRRVGVEGDGPVYLAEQFYGSGRVFYLGSGEMWRLRRLDEGYFERLYTRLIRHVAQGRLLRQSSRGVLMVAQDQYQVGATVQIRAQLTNAQLAPWIAPAVPLQVYPPTGRAQSVTLRPDPSRPGTFAGQMTVLCEGDYRLELPVPESADEVLTRRIQVTMPDLERQNPQRNSKLLARLADGSHGKYYEDLDAAIGPHARDPLVQRLKDRTKTVVFTSAPDPLRQEMWLKWLMYGIAAMLLAEWLIRRLAKLA